MAIQPVCDRCGKELLTFGGLLFSPPNVQNQVQKFHLCSTCYDSLVESFIKK